MAFYLSPLVDVKEIDLSTTIPAVATSIGVLVLRNGFKGPEMKKTFVTSEDELYQIFGAPTTYSYEDWFAAAGYLKYGNKLYVTRTMPLSATFSGVKISGGDYTQTFDQFTSADALTLADLGNPDDLEWGDPNDYDEEDLVVGSSLMEMIAASRGAWGNHTRVSMLSYDDQQEFFLPYSDPANTAEVSGWYPYEWNVEGTALVLRSNWTQADADKSTYETMYGSDVTLQNDKEFLLFVQTRDNEDDDWDLQESWYLSTDELKMNDDGRTMYAETVINNVSRYVRINMDGVGAINQAWNTSTNTFQMLGGGTDYDTINYSFPTVETATQFAALDLYDNPEEIDVTIFIDGAKDEVVKSHMIAICEARKDCMTVVDCPSNLVIDNRGNETTDLVDWRTERGTFFGTGFNENTSYAALYANWIEIFDKYNNKYRWVPMSGHAAGIYAKTDDVADPWWAPAGLNRAILTSVRRLAWNPKLGHRDLLYKNGLNPIVSFAGQGKVIWGQKTMLDKSSSFNRVNVRRLFIVLEKAISTAAKYFLFEPNDHITRRQLKSMIQPFLRDVQARRGIYDYQVICDETNNTPERIDRNELWCTILIKATRVAEFIVLQFVSLKTGASFEESAKAVQ